MLHLSLEMACPERQVPFGFPPRLGRNSEVFFGWDRNFGLELGRNSEVPLGWDRNFGPGLGRNSEVNLGWGRNFGPVMDRSAKLALGPMGFPRVGWARNSKLQEMLLELEPLYIYSHQSSIPAHTHIVLCYTW